MKVLFTTQPGHGHFHPVVPIARALADAGHEVAFACAARYQPFIHRAGFITFAAGLDWLEADYRRTFPQLAELPLHTLQLRFLSDIFAGSAADAMAKDLLEICRTWQPDLLVRTDYEFAACIVGELQRIPYATIGIHFGVPLHYWQTVVGTPIALLRRRFGLPPTHIGRMLFRQPYLSCIPREYQFPNLPGPTSIAMQFLPYEEQVSDGDDTPPWASRDLPNVYVTFGTVFNEVPTLFRDIFEGLRQSAVNALVTIGHGRRPEGLPVSPSIHVREYVPLHRVLPACDLVITHGGLNTVMAALRHALPLLVIPLCADQPLHARRCVDLGVGQALYVPGSAFDAFAGPGDRPFSAEAVGAAVGDLLTEGQYRRRARDMARAIRSAPEPAAVVERLVAAAGAAMPASARAGV